MDDSRVAEASRVSQARQLIIRKSANLERFSPITLFPFYTHIQTQSFGKGICVVVSSSSCSHLILPTSGFQRHKPKAKCFRYSILLLRFLDSEARSS